MKAIITRRRDQLDYKRAAKMGKELPCGNQIVGGVIFCESKEGQEGWVRRLFKAGIANRFVFFRDVQSPYAVQFVWADWAGTTDPSVMY